MVKTSLIVIFIVTAVLSLGVGLLIGFLSSKPKTKENPINEYYAKLIQNEDVGFREKLSNEIKADNIKNHLKIMTNSSHMGGTPGDKSSAEYLYKTWNDDNMDYVKLIDYEVFLSYPNKDKPNR